MHVGDRRELRAIAWSWKSSTSQGRRPSEAPYEDDLIVAVHQLSYLEDLQSIGWTETIDDKEFGELVMELERWKFEMLRVVLVTACEYR